MLMHYDDGNINVFRLDLRKNQETQQKSLQVNKRNSAQNGEFLQCPKQPTSELFHERKELCAFSTFHKTGVNGRMYSTEMRLRESISSLKCPFCPTIPS